MGCVVAYAETGRDLLLRNHVADLETVVTRSALQLEAYDAACDRDFARASFMRVFAAEFITTSR